MDVVSNANATILAELAVKEAVLQQRQTLPDRLVVSIDYAGIHL